MGCGYLFIIIIFFVNVWIVVFGCGFDYIRFRSMGRDDCYWLCGEIGIEFSVFNFYLFFCSYIRFFDVFIFFEG